MKNSLLHTKYPVILVESHDGAVFLVLQTLPSFTVIVIGASLQFEVPSHQRIKLSRSSLKILTRDLATKLCPPLTPTDPYLLKDRKAVCLAHSKAAALPREFKVLGL